MNDEYELFERRADGVLSWRGIFQGIDSARIALQLLADDTDNECFALQPRTRQHSLIRIPEPAGPRAFQIDYGPHIHARAAMLHRRGYDVTAVRGNAAALLMLVTRPHYDLFVIGHETTADARSQMIDWLRRCYDPSVILPLDCLDTSAPDPSYPPIRSDRITDLACTTGRLRTSTDATVGVER